MQKRIKNERNTVKCIVCNKEELVSPSRFKNYKTCSISCSSKYRLSLVVLNCECKNCGKPFHRKESHVRKNSSIGNFCSQKCTTFYKKQYYLGENNPNFRGRQYDSNGYRINHYPKIGRVKEHLFVTLNYLNLSKIPKGYCIHHRDCNIYNNIPENLAVLKTNDHRWLHKQFGNATLWAFAHNKIDYESLLSWSNDIKKCELLKTNLTNQTGVFKLGELSETPEVVNTELSTNLND